MTDGERLITVMLAEVMEALNLNNLIDPIFVKTLVCSGDEWAIQRKYRSLLSVSGPTSDEISETTNILRMWDIIEKSVGRLEGAQAEEARGWSLTKFNGFDPKEKSRLEIAYILINELGDFSDFRGRALINHAPSSLGCHQRMYIKFSKFAQSDITAHLPFEALRDLCV